MSAALVGVGQGFDGTLVSMRGEILITQTFEPCCSTLPQVEPDSISSLNCGITQPLVVFKRGPSIFINSHHVITEDLMIWTLLVDLASEAFFDIFDGLIISEVGTKMRKFLFFCLLSRSDEYLDFAFQDC